MAKELPEGFKCKCGKFNKFTPYVYAHADELLLFKCECKREYDIRNFRAKEVKE